MTAAAASAPRAGDVLELAVGEVAHGGWCVARDPDTGWVVFVRHALPGERVRAVITQATARFARADAVEILQASAGRVPPPCRYAGPGGCGGCDWQHASLPAQRALKAAVVRQQLGRIGGIDRDVAVQSVDGDQAGLGWRTAVTFAVDAAGVAGLHRHRSHEVVQIDSCAIAHPLVTGTGVTGARWPSAQTVQVCVAPHGGERGVTVTRPGKAGAAGLPGVQADSVQVAGRSGARTPVRGRGYLTQRAAGREWRVSLGGFWQVHPGAADALAAAVLAALDPHPGESGLDLYCGAGLFAGVLAEAVGPEGAVLAIEQDAAAVRDARHNLRPWSWARTVRGDAAVVLQTTDLTGASFAVIDPPRAGAARPVIDALCRAPLQRIAYVSCDPATLARDLRLLLDGGWQLGELRGFDAFPMTHHVECLATLGRK
jgi:tRNA/tmRNA/rRNA uracil-C5-methylase (TrmA/RlmC/RlmD family)